MFLLINHKTHKSCTNSVGKLNQHSKALKSSGFNIEDTHLTDVARIEKLFALVLIAFTWAYKAGVYLDSLCPIKTKRHGRKVKSLFKYGFNFIAKLLSNNNIGEFEKYCKFLLCT